MSSGSSEEELSAAPRRNPLEVITDYLQQFDGGDQSEAYERPSAEALIRWLRQEGWQISPMDVIAIGGTE